MLIYLVNLWKYLLQVPQFSKKNWKRIFFLKIAETTLRKNDNRKLQSILFRKFKFTNSLLIAFSLLIFFTKISTYKILNYLPYISFLNGTFFYLYSYTDIPLNNIVEKLYCISVTRMQYLLCVTFVSYVIYNCYSTVSLNPKERGYQAN